MGGALNVEPLRIGVIGVGVISEQYFANFPRLPGLELVAVADLNTARAAEVAAERGVEAMAVDALIADPRIEAVLNLTIPAAHAQVDLKVLQAGKHVYGEKPLASTVAEGRRVLEVARDRGLRVGSAPDTVLGTGIQTARQVMDAGRLGDPVGASVHWTAPGHELWHPAPDFYYQPGAGPLFDMGPYYLTSLVLLLGPVVRVTGTATRSTRERVIASGPRAGQSIPVETDTHVVAILEHEGGAISTVTVSFEVWESRAPLFEVYGTAGTLAVPDPNRFSDEVEIWTTASEDWAVVPTSAGYADAGRGYGLADLARAVRTDRAHRASGELGLHVLEIMEAVLRSSRERVVIDITTTAARGDIVPLGATPASW
ncbi:MAG: oxidoreductase [Glaciihabitans sp.]|nr:oxidoreductase [Glaciihabitans sp.]